jgi:hypothetical protein
VPRILENPTRCASVGQNAISEVTRKPDITPTSQNRSRDAWIWHLSTVRGHFGESWEQKNRGLDLKFCNWTVGQLSGCGMNAVHGYRAKAWECLSLAESVNDPERRADLLRFARMWMSLTEPIGDLPMPKSPYELPPQISPPIRP